jgi:hypothetical protein
MATLHRVRARWSGFQGSPGFSNFYFDTAALPNLGALRTFFDSSKGFWAPGVSVQIENTGDTISDQDGSLQGSWSTTSVFSVDSAGTGGYAGAAGAVVHWNTSTVVRGRRLRGRTFLVPMNSSAYDTSGTISSGLKTNLEGAAAAMVSALGSTFRIWSRPLRNPTTGAITANGTNSAVTSSRVPDLAVSLRSRRD